MAKTIWKCTCRPIDGAAGAVCGQPAVWLATHVNGAVSLFCAECRETAWERKHVREWTTRDGSFAHLQIGRAHV